MKIKPKSIQNQVKIKPQIKILPKSLNNKPRWRNSRSPPRDQPAPAEGLAAQPAASQPAGRSLAGVATESQRKS